MIAEARGAYSGSMDVVILTHKQRGWIEIRAGARWSFFADALDQLYRFEA